MAKVDVKCHILWTDRPCKKTRLCKSSHQHYRYQSYRHTSQIDYGYRTYQPRMKDQIVYLAMNNAGIRDIAQALHININAVVRTLKNSRRGM
ncbi:insertion sequence protein [Yersinia frederiksenii]|nr:insertion sequence protein [Yersinia frederiksenii]HEI6967706.1 IS1 family transposase [Yersinia enterocolitica]